jgi:hypothetical protein
MTMAYEGMGLLGEVTSGKSPLRGILRGDLNPKILTG